MMVHHVATIGLLSFSWVSNWVRAGSLVLLVHDAADSWLSVSCSFFLNLTLHFKVAPPIKRNNMKAT